MNGKADLYTGKRMYHPNAMTGHNTTYRYINTFQPLRWQVKPWSDISPVVLFSGSRGGGKSRLCGERIHAFCLKYPNSICQVVRKTKSSIGKSVLHNLTKKVIGEDPRVIHHASDGMFLYDNGSVLYYDGMTDPAARERLKSREPDMVWMEEAKDFDEEDFNEIRALVRGTAAPWRQIMLSTNPDGPLHWINRRLILGGEAVVYYSGAKDNPHLPPEYIANLESLTGVQYQRDVLGHWVSGSGLIFDTWIDDQMSNDTNVTEKAEIIPHGGDIIWAIDDGYSGRMDETSGLYTASSHPRAIILVQRRQDGILAIADESHAIETLASNHLAELLTKWPRPYMVVRDRAAASLDGACRENGLKNIVYNTMNVDESIKEMRTWIAADVNGVRKVIVNPRCKMLRFQMAQYSTDADGKVIKQHDDFPDALRYIIWNEAYGRGRKVDIVSWKAMANQKLAQASL